jgi:translocation and assembly module TamB
MKKRVLLIAATAVAVLFGTLYWLLGTPGGALWLMKTGSARAGLVLDAQGVQGRLWGDLRVQGLRIVWKDGTFLSHGVALQWKPLSLLSGTFSVKRLELDRTEIIDESPARQGPVDLSWPRLAGLPTLVDVGIDLLKISRLTYRRPSEPAVGIASLESSIIWHEGTLAISVLHAETGSARAKGRIKVGLMRPALSMEATAVLLRPKEGIDRIAVQATLGENGEKGAQLSGHITFSAMSGKSQILSVVSDVSVSKTAVGIKDLVLAADRRRGAIRGSGRLDFPGGKPRVTMELRVDDLDLSRETRFLSHMSGSLGIEARDDSYRGSFDLANEGTAWRKARLAGSFEGNHKSVRFLQIEGKLLRGVLGGELEVGWEEGLSLTGSLSGRKLDPSVISPEWYGSVNFDMEGRLAKEESGMNGLFSARFLESNLRGAALNGDMQARVAGGEVVSARLLLEGKGFLVRAGGDIRRRISFSLKANDLSALIPDTKGKVSAEGWVKVLKGRVAGSLSASGAVIAARGLRIGSFNVSGGLEASEGHPLEFRADIRNISYGAVGANSLLCSAKGTEAKHAIRIAAQTGKYSVDAGFEGGYADGVWQGRILRLSGRDGAGPFSMPESSALRVSSNAFTLSPLIILGEEGERMELSAEMGRRPLAGEVQAEWAQLNLLHAAWAAPDLHLSGESSGRLRAAFANDRLLTLAADVSASGRLVLGGKTIGFRGASAVMNWDRSGMEVSVNTDLSEGGMLRGHLVSGAPATLSLPLGGDVALAWSGIDLTFFRLWVPRDLDLKGSLEGKADGKWTEGGHLQMRISASVLNGVVRLKEEKGTISAVIRSAAVSAYWRGKSMKGNISVDLADYGEASVQFAVPLPARLPAEMDRKGPLSVWLHGRAHENGLLTSLFPGLVRESSGEAELSLKAEGQWDAPALSGGIRIEKAGAYFPATGIHIKDVSLSARFDKNTVTVEAFHASSGPGSLDGTAVIRLKGWRLEDYRGNLKGDRFQAVYLPDLRVLASPAISFEGTVKKLVLKGEIRVPELLATGSSEEVVKPSPDVVLTDSVERESAEPWFAANIDVKIVMGDQVFVKEQGVDVQLKGSVEIAATNMKDITGNGQIDIVKGKYSAYGVNLAIERGKLLFSGGPVDDPALNVLALRKSNDVKAGVLVTGTLISPRVSLYSEPSMADTDILAFIVLGHPLGSGGQEQSDLLLQAAGRLLSAGQSVVLQDKIKRTIGLDTLDVGAGNGNVARSMVTVGKYLTPKLYISYGRSLFGVGDLFRARYSLTKKWEVDVTSGAENGWDIFYKIEIR